nr:MAG TPA: hypothetical protein [Caudoviricetes sp.]
MLNDVLLYLYNFAILKTIIGLNPVATYSLILSSPSYLNVIDTFLGHFDLSVGQSISSDLNILDIFYISFTELSVSLS